MQTILYSAAVIFTFLKNNRQFKVPLKNSMGEIKMSSKKRFEVIHSEGGFSGVVEILVDKETGVNYLFRASGYAGGLTPLLDREGKPVVSTVLQEE